MKSTGEDVRRNPVPSLLRSLMTEHLDPGYEATAFERQHEHTKNRPSKTGPWLALGALLIGFIVTVSAVQATKQVTGTEEVRSELVAKVRDAEDRIDSLAASRDSLGGAVDAARGGGARRRRTRQRRPRSTASGRIRRRSRSCSRGGTGGDVDGPGRTPEPLGCVPAERRRQDRRSRSRSADRRQRAVGGRRRGNRRRRRANRADGNHPSSPVVRCSSTTNLSSPRTASRRSETREHCSESSSSATPT